MRLMTHLKMRVTQSRENTVHLHWANINEPPVWTPRQHNSLPASPLCSSDKDIIIQAIMIYNPPMEHSHILGLERLGKMLHAMEHSEVQGHRFHLGFMLEREKIKGNDK